MDEEGNSGGRQFSIVGTEKPFTVWIEPWAVAYTLGPGDHLDVLDRAARHSIEVGWEPDHLVIWTNPETLITTKSGERIIPPQ